MQRYPQWVAHGLPDLRGFVPHLRTVNVLAVPRTEWLLHDLLHIMFYDFATINLGENSWLIYERFLENHLASEAFAVLALDYHVLPFANLESLASDFNPQQWPRFQKVNPLLPDYNSLNFTEALVKLYLCGEPGSLLPRRPLPPKSSYARWLGHEMRYSVKQRGYVQAWFDDLMLVTPTFREPKIKNTFVESAVHDLLQIFIYSADDQWGEYLGFCRSKLAGKHNIFSKFPKYRKSTTRRGILKSGLQDRTLDFRFTDITALGQKRLLAETCQFHWPNASGLFLIWQILCSRLPSTFSEAERLSIAKLARAANRTADAGSGRPTHISSTTWSAVAKIAEEILCGARGSSRRPLRPRTLSTFFLP